MCIDHLKRFFSEANCMELRGKSFEQKQQITCICWDPLTDQNLGCPFCKLTNVRFLSFYIDTFSQYLIIILLMITILVSRQIYSREAPNPSFWYIVHLNAIGSCFRSVHHWTGTHLSQIQPGSFPIE